MVPLASTFLMAPSFDFPIDGSIQLGNLLVDPFTPHRPLVTLAPGKLPETIESLQENRNITSKEVQHARFSMWLKALQLVDGRTGVETGQRMTTNFKMNAIRTLFLKTDPDDEDIRELLDAPKVQSAMRSTFWSRPVFLISGLKVAEGFSLRSETGTRRNADARLSAAATCEVSLGMDTGISAEMDEFNSFQSGQDIVVAYQLLKISRKRRDLAIKEYRPKAGFLGDEDRGPQLSEEFEVTTVTEEDLANVDEDVVLENVIADEDGTSILIASVEP